MNGELYFIFERLVPSESIKSTTEICSEHNFQVFEMFAGCWIKIDVDLRVSSGFQADMELVCN